jgi:hypothetical protein
MKLTRHIRRWGIGVLALCVLVACSPPQEPARHAVQNVDTAVSAVATQGQEYLPEQFASLQQRASALKAAYDRGDYKQVLADAPTLLNDLQALGAAAAARNAAAMKVLEEEWKALAASIPDLLGAVQDRIDTLSNNKKDAAKVDLGGARASMNGVDEQWSKAQETYTAGDLTAAVKDARGVKNRAEAAARSLKLSFPDAPSPR